MLYINRLWITVFENDDETVIVQDLENQLSKIADSTSPEYKRTSMLLSATKTSLDIKQGKYLAQDRVNALLAEDKRKHQQAHQRTLDELQALKQKANLSSEEREELERRINETQNLLKTKEETAAQEKEKLLKNHKKEVETLTTDRETWKKRFTKMTVTNSIISAAAASTPKAVNPEQILVILQPKTRLVEELDDEGKPTGNFVPRVSFVDKDKKGKPITLELSPDEAVKRMSEMEEHFNLFMAEGNSGFGRTRGPRGKETSLRDLAKDPEAYRQARKSGQIKF
jgi:chromosome segregation ATPase